MSSRWKKVWADLWGNKSRTILTMVTIAVGTFAVGFTVNMNSYMSESMDGDYLSANPSEATVYAYPLDDDMVKIARTIPGVDAVEGRSTLSAQLIKSEEEESIRIIFTALKDPNELTLNLLKPAPGEMSLPTFSNKEMLVDYSAASLGYKPGDTLVIELRDGKRREMVLAGYVHDVTGIPYNLANMVGAYVTPKTLEWLGGSSYYDTLAISVSEKQTDADHVTEIAQAVSDRMEQGGTTDNFVEVYEPGHHFAYSISQGMFFVLGVFGYLTVLLSGFLIVNTITALMTQQTRQIGIMKAVGGRGGQIAGMYLVFVLTCGLLALLIAVPLAAFAAYGSCQGMSNFINISLRGFRVTPQAIIAQIITALIVPLAAAAVPVLTGTRISVREAINDYGMGSGVSSQGWLNRLVERVRFFSRPVLLSLRNAFRRKGRMVLTLAALTLGGAIFIAVFNLWRTCDVMLNEAKGYFIADINVSFAQPYPIADIKRLGMDVPEVTGVE
ncbi:MAG: ABC transporter permease, partial [Anaerolineales bacterium]|nr:ABC transporter permease [Anaerolineales bacterium]